MKSVSIDELIEKYGSKDRLVELTFEFSKNIESLCKAINILVDDFGEDMLGYTNLGVVLAFSICDNNMVTLVRGTESGVINALSEVREAL